MVSVYVLALLVVLLVIYLFYDRFSPGEPDGTRRVPVIQ